MAVLFKDVVGAQSQEGMSPLHEATLDDSVHQINERLEAGADLNARDRDGATPLHWAAAGNSHQAVDRLIEAGADPDIRDKSGSTPLHWGASYGAREAIDRLLQAGADPNSRDEEGRTALHYSGSSLSPETVERLIEAEADPNARDRQQETPLHQVHFVSSPETVERLLEAGADPTARNHLGQTPLHRAAHTRSIRSLELMLEAGANPDSRGPDGRTALHDAAALNSPVVADRLIKAGANVNARDEKGSTPLHYSAAAWSSDTVDRLLEAGADPQAQDKDGKRPPMHHAIDRNRLEVVNRLLEAGMDPNTRDSEESTLLHRAARTGSPRIVERLLEAGADPHARDNQGRTALHWASGLDKQVDWDSDRTYKFKTGDRIAAIDHLLKAGASVYARDDKGRTPLHEAAALDSPEVAGRLINDGANVNARDVEGRSALHEAAMHSSPDTAQRLIEAGANVNARDEKGKTALEYGTERMPGADEFREVIEQHQARQKRTAEPAKVQDAAQLERSASVSTSAQQQEQRQPEQAAPPKRRWWRRPGKSSDRVAAGGRADHRSGDVPEQQPERQPTRSPESVQADVNSPNGESAARKQTADQRPDKSDAAGKERIEQRQQQQLPRAARPQQRNRQSKPDRPDKQRSGARPQGGSKKSTSARKFAEDASERCIKLLEKGVAPWQKGWDRPTDAPAPPHNPVSKTRYKGLNTVVLRSVAAERGYSDPRWLTYNQARQIGAQVRKGERGTTVEYWKFPDPKAEGKEPGKPDAAERSKEPEQRRIIHRTYTVFNAEQCDKMPPLEKEPKQPQRWETCERAERLLESSGARIEHKAGDMAYYHPKQDKIVLPKQEQFRNPEAYYSTAMHELGHWTGHENRMNRETLTQGVKDGFDSDNYAKEELRAEMTSMTVNGVMKLPHDPERHAAYVGSWIKALKDDPNELRHAARDAGRMADYILEHDRDRPREVSQAPRRAGDAVPTPERQMAMQNELEKGVERSSSVALSR